MRSITLLILVISLISCKEKRRDQVDFDSIDYTYYIGYFASIKILNNGNTYILFEDNIDSIYIAKDADHPISFNLIIKSNKRTLSTKYFGAIERVKQQSLLNMANFLYNQCDKIRDPFDTTFVFESKSGLILPVPAPIESN